MSKRILNTKIFYFALAIVLFAVAFFNYSGFSSSAPHIVAATVSCTDSDGSDYYRKGSVVTCDDEGECMESVFDSCSSDMLTEQVCQGGEISTETYTCPNTCNNSQCLRGANCFSNSDCTSGDFCEFNGCGASVGRCVVKPSGACSTIYDPTCGCNGTTYTNSCARQKVGISQDHIGRCGVSCTDSDGKDYHNKGTIDGWDTQGKHLVVSDSCVGDNVREYYCGTSDFAEYTDYKCPQGCSSGACNVVELILGCTDSTAENYNAKAERDDGSCTFPVVIVEPEPDPVVILEPEPESELFIYPKPEEVVTQSAWVAQERSLAININKDVTNNLKGRILLQVEEHGEAWYVDPSSEAKYYLKNGEVAYEALKKFGLGITNNNLAKIPVGIEDRFIDIDTDGDGLADKLEEGLGTDFSNPDTDGDGFSDFTEVQNNFNPLGAGSSNIDESVVNKLKGKILLQVESRGEAWYVNPDDGKRYYMKNGESAYQIMRFLSLGITNDNLRKIAVGDLE